MAEQAAIITTRSHCVVVNTGTSVISPTNTPLNDVVEGIFGDVGKNWLGTCVLTDPKYFLEVLGEPDAIRHPTRILKDILEAGDNVFCPRVRQDETDPLLLAQSDEYGTGMQTVYSVVCAMSDTDVEPHVVAAWARRVALSAMEGR